jgi:hypothetical protein
VGLLPTKLNLPLTQLAHSGVDPSGCGVHTRLQRRRSTVPRSRRVGSCAATCLKQCIPTHGTGATPRPENVLPHHVTLLHAIARARGWLKRMESDAVSSMAPLARAEGLADRYVTRLLRCAFLAPEIIEALLAGSAPAEMTLASVLKDVPMDWVDQRRRFGFATRRHSTPSP